MVITFETAGHTKNSCGLTPPTLRIRGMRYYFASRTSIHIYIYTYRTSSNLYTPDSGSLASLARQLIRVEPTKPR